MSELFTEPTIPELTLEQIIAQGSTRSETKTVTNANGIETIVNNTYTLSDNGRFNNPTIIGGTIRDTGITVKENDGTNIFSLIKTGADTGDVIIGNYAGGQGAKYDKSAGTFLFGTGIYTPSVRYGKTSFTDSTNAGYWVSSAGFYFGSASDANYIKYNISTGAFDVLGKITTATGSVIDGQYVNALAVSKLSTGTISSKAITLGITAGTGDSYINAGKTDFDNTQSGFIIGIDDSDSDRAKFFIGDSDHYFNWNGVTADATGFRYLEQFTAGENLADGDIVCITPSYADYVASEDSYVSDQAVPNEKDTNYGTEDKLEAGNYDGGNFQTYIKWVTTTMPSAENILKAELILTVYAFLGNSRNITISRVSGADWSEGTITYNNQPTSTGDIDEVHGHIDYVLSGSNPTTITFDITRLVRHWKAGTVNNYGVFIADNSGTARIAFCSSEHGTGASQPKLRIWSTQTSDGKVYKAKNDDYLLCRSVVGVVQGAVSADATAIVQVAGQINNVAVSSTGGKVYLHSTAGGVIFSTSNAPRVITLGKIINTNKFLWSVQEQGIPIEKLNPIIEMTATTDTLKFYAPSDARSAKVKMLVAAGKVQEVTIPRSSEDSNNIVFNDFEGVGWTIAWGANYITVDCAGAKSIKDLIFYT